MTAGPSAGWYADPSGAAPLRWWDGGAWTSATATSAPTAPQSWGGPPSPRPRGRVLRRAVSLTATLAVGLGVSLLLEQDPTSLGQECDGARSALCTHHVLQADPWVWPAGPDGRIVVHYRVDPRIPDGQPVDAADLVAATRLAAEAWERARPGIDLVDDGPTRRRAGTADGVNVVGFGRSTDDAVASASYYGDADDPEVDVVLEHEGELWVHRPCGSATCPGHVSDDEDIEELGRDDELAELQSVITHELGHLLGLDHSSGEALTMSSDWFNDAVFPQTLGLGDVLGVRALYPCTCPEPDVADD